ncbi:gliding motility-associated C-terminal domain-containing protein [Aestuariibaculum sp. M13]|uniref:gliding motility-associated C-terminal domain-containing protein n=1 Tax=Aestuariibaculum sp. M13 TaxID=2967132 RepID=UPI002159D952|nr:gliding motility-associated C-terminal domain-containing protein [Aestuariibaculum sp. M13]MCR8667800.1 gliding motility-associated C-terminal domain-containing protein [Aestuariibaculum sp. M13]
MRNFTFIGFIVFFASVINFTYAQTISTPSLGFTQACASPSFNTYYTTFSFSADIAASGSNQFTIELSDANGSFANGQVILTTSAGQYNTSPATVQFSLPLDTAGESYKIRVKSSSPSATSVGSVSFPAYYKIQDSPFTINNLIGTAAFCAGGSYLLTIDNPGTGDNDSPLKYPSLTFNWYRETSSTTSTLVGTGETFNVTSAGTYYCETNYGSCTSDSYSNRVTISEASSGTSSEISSSLGNPYCSAEGATTLSTINADAYQWYKDGKKIDGATSQTYVTDESGTYSVSIDLGQCSTTASITLETSGFTSSIDVDETNSIQEGEALTATVTTTANSPTFQWYLNNNLISGAAGNSYTAAETGDYKVVVTQTSGCAASEEFLFSLFVTEPFPDVSNIPNIISPNGDGINDTWTIPVEYTSGSNTEVIIMSAQGKVVHQTNNYLNNWPENQIDFNEINPVYYYIITTANNAVKKGSITVVK